MRKRFLVLATLIAALVVGASAATAAPTDVAFTMNSHAQYVSPTTVLVEVSLNCDPFLTSTGTPGAGFASVSLRSEETGGTGGGFTLIPCTGETETAVVVVNGGPFVPGAAVASGVGCGHLCDSDVRRIQIVL